MQIKLIKPTLEQLAYTKHLWLCEETMRDVGGTRSKADEEWHEWYAKMVEPTDNCNQYFLVYAEDVPVGEISFHKYNLETKSANFNIKVESKHRKKGYAKAAVVLFKNYFFDEFGGAILSDEVTSPSGIKTLQRLGFDLKLVDEDIHYFEMHR